MTIYGLLASLAWSVAMLYALLRAIDAAERMAVRRLAARVVDASDVANADWPVTVTGLPRKHVPSKKSIVVPDDLVAVAMTYSDQWATDDFIQVAKEKYQSLYDGDEEATWQRVRRAIGIGEMP